MSRKGDQAHTWAKEIYSIAAESVLAGSIRAVEQFIEEKIDNPKSRFAHRIRVVEGDVLKYVGKRALAYIAVGGTRITVDRSLEAEHRRRAVAHELAHVLFAKSNWGDGKIVTDRETEEACVIFEKDLCKRHHEFYANPANVEKLKFSSFATG